MSPPWNEVVAQIIVLTSAIDDKCPCFVDFLSVRRIELRRTPATSVEGEAPQLIL